jgi:transaldolase
VPFGRQGAEAILEPRQHRLGQGDLGEQHQDLRLRIQSQRLGHRLQVDLRLSGAGHAVEQGRLEASLPGHVLEDSGRGRLAVVQRRARAVGVGLGEGAVGLDQLDPQAPFVDQGLDHPGGNPRPLRQLGGGGGERLGGVQHPAALRRGPAWIRAGGDQTFLRLGPRGAGAAQRDGQRPARGIHGVARRPVDELQRPLRQAEVLDLLQHRLQWPIHPGAVAQADHDTAQPMGDKQRDHHAASVQRHPLRFDVIERLRQGHGQEDGGYPHLDPPPRRGGGVPRGRRGRGDEAPRLPPAPSGAARHLPRFAGEDLEATTPANSQAGAFAMQLFIDTADTDVLRTLAQTGLVDGVTTNPTLIAKSGRNILQVIAEICAIVEGPISAEVAATDYEGMLAEGRKLAKIAENVTVKLPLTVDGLRATAVFHSEGVNTNVTLCFSAAQALLAAKAGATFVSPFVGRLDDHGADGMGLIAEIRAIYDNFDYDTEILAASIRTPKHVEQAAIAGADCATIPPATFQALFKHPLTDKGLDQFMADWKGANQSIL